MRFRWIGLLPLLSLAMPAAAATGAGSITVTVTPPPNRPPVMSPIAVEVTRGTPITIDIAPYISDPDGDPVTVCRIEPPPAHGTAAVQPGNKVAYTPAAGYTGPDSFGVVVADGACPEASVDPPTLPAPLARTWERISPVAMTLPSGPDDVVGLRVENRGSGAIAARYETVGQVFVAGEIPAGSHLMARVGSQLVPVQMDVKTTYADGSVKHAVLTLPIPALAAGASVEAMLIRSDAPPPGPPLAVSQALPNVQLTLMGVTRDAVTVLHAGPRSQWLSGPFVSEWRAEAPINGDIKARFDVRVYADGSTRVDVIAARDATYTASPDFMKSRSYSGSLVCNGQTALTLNSLVHFQNANWHRVCGASPLHVVHDVDHLIATGAVPSYDTSLGVDNATLNGLSTGNIAPMGNGTVTQEMQSTGGRPDIGALPTWSAQALVSQDPRATAAMLANANASGSIPWHFVDETTSSPVRLDQHPGLWIDYRQAGGSSADALPVTHTFDNTPWIVDGGHEPSLTYLPYLLTGSRYFLDEMQAQASFNVASTWPWYRDPATHTFASQLRSGAWQLRTLVHAAIGSPDGDPLKAYFTAQANQLLNHLVDINITRGLLNWAGQWRGWFWADYPEGVIAPWQNDFMVMALAEAGRAGFQQAVTLSEWTESFTAGRFLNGDNGYDPLAGPTYYLSFGAQPSTWAAVYQASFAGNTSTELGYGAAYPNTAGGYAAGARGALAALFNVTRSVDALAAFGYVVSQTQNGGMPAGFASDPTFFITPRLPDGSVLAIGDMKVATGPGALAMIVAKPCLLYGSAGADTLTAGPRSCALFGANGNDTIKGGPGNDYIYGGKGNDRLEGGPGADTFVFDKVNAGQDVIADFKPGEDKIVFGTANVANKGLTVAGLLAGATIDGAGNLVLHPGSGSDITLEGVRALSAADIIIE